MMAIPDDMKIPARVRAVLERVSTGQRLVKSFRNKESGNTEVEFFYEPSGRRCGPKSAEAAIATGLLVPKGDGLFGAEFSQSWVAP